MFNFSITKDEFFKRHFEQKPFFQKGALQPEYVSWSDINEFLYLLDPTAPFLRVFKDGALQESEFAESYFEHGLPRRRIKKRAFYDLLGDGATAVLNRLEFASSKVRRLCLAISSYAGGHAIANGYLAFGGTGTFGKHWDTHDVFAVQLIGRKHWRVYEPTVQVPLRDQTSRFVKDTCPETPVFDQILEPGDVLYIPRGWWHEAAPSEGETFHVAIGVHLPTITDYVIWCSNEYLKAYEECRYSFPQNEHSSADFTLIGNIVTKELTSLSNIEQFRRAWATNMKISTPLDVDLFNPSLPNNLGLTAQLVLNSNMWADRPGNPLTRNEAPDRRGELSDEIIALLSHHDHLSVERLMEECKPSSSDQVLQIIHALIKENAVIVLNY